MSVEEKFINVACIHLFVCHFFLKDELRFLFVYNAKGYKYSLNSTESTCSYKLVNRIYRSTNASFISSCFSEKKMF